MSDTKPDFLGLFKMWPRATIGLDDDRNIVTVSDKAVELLGWSDVELQGRNIHDTLCSADRVSFHEPEHCGFGERLLALDNGFGSCYWVARDGTGMSLDYRVVNFDVDGISALIFVTDNSELTYSLAEMQKFTAMLEHSPSPVVEFDGFGQLIYGNVAFGALLDKFDFNEFGAARVLPENIEDLCQSILQQRDKKISSVETSVDGYYFEWHFQVLESGGQEKIISYGFDVTEKVQHMKSMEEEQSKIRKEFLAKMVHELRTPLNAIIGFSEILISRIGSQMEAPNLKRLQSIKSAGCQLNDMITDTLEFSKIESGHMSVDVSEFSLAELCETVSEQMRTLAEQKNLEYKQELLSSRSMRSDKNKIRQILVNIVSNAIKYTPKGRVHVLLSDVDDFELGDAFKIAVLDTGVGVPEDKIDTLFDSYTKVENARTTNVQGTGLGLSLVRDMMGLLGGRVSVNSIVEKGSVFELVFPKEYRNAV